MFVLSIDLIYGSKQIIIDNIIPNTPTTGKATLVVKNINNSSIINNSVFKGGDKVEIVGVEDPILYNGIHTITGENNGNPVITINCDDPGTGGYILMKKLEIGNGIWRTKNYSNYKCFYSQNRTYNTNMLAINDIVNENAIARIYFDIDKLSDELIIRKNYISVYSENFATWSIIGDDKRFYLLIGYAVNSTNFTDIIVYGDIENDNYSEGNNNVFCVLSGYNEEYGSFSMNETLYYNNYSILASGKLAFYKENKEENNNNGTSLIYANNSTTTKINGKGNNSITLLPIIPNL